MKALSSAWQDKYASGTTTLATALLLTRPGVDASDDEHFGFTEHDEPVEIDGVTYLADPGLQITNIAISANADVGNLELQTLHDGTIFTPGDILGGRWRGTTFYIFRYDWTNPADGVDPLLAGVVGNITLKNNMVVAELRDLRQHLQLPIGDVSQKTCRYRVGDNRCKVNMAPFTKSGTITSVSNPKRVFTDSSRVEPADFFGFGSIRFMSGNAEGIDVKVDQYAANGTFTLSLPLFVNVEVGDTYVAKGGCRGRLEEDCGPKFGNHLNFGAEPHRRLTDNITQTPDAEV